jgi:isoquinoline 1-oxidoreductase/isoquinoline 1-oxidoreductase beta subunit
MTRTRFPGSVFDIAPYCSWHPLPIADASALDYRHLKRKQEHVMDIRRRQFVRNTVILGGSLVIGFELAGCSREKIAVTVSGSFQPSSFLELTPDGRIILFLNRAEMGQGVSTGFATLVAEELDIPPATITIEYAPIHADFGNIQITGGSASIKDNFELLRQVGANARAVLLGAAAREWTVAVDTLVTDNGKVLHPPSKREATYASLIATANTLPVPNTAPLKDPAQFQWIGKYGQRIDSLEKVQGAGIFGIDVQREGMLHAVVVRCPHFGGSLKSFDAAAARQGKNVHDIFALDDRSIAVVASGYWFARKAAEKLQIEWNKGRLAGLDSAGIRNALQQRLDEGDDKSVDKSSADVIEATYYAPYQAHAPMEPLNCVADVRADRVDIWTGNQCPEVFRESIADVLQRPRETVFVHQQMLGGGFGRRFYPDYAIEAALISAKTGKPVKLLWSREDDLRHDYYRPPALSRFRVQLRDGGVAAWENRLATPSVMQGAIPIVVHAVAPWVPQSVLRLGGEMLGKRDPISAEGASKLLYVTQELNFDYAYFDPGIPLGSWRSVGNSFNGFFVESFVDEIAQALKQDPLAFRLAQLKPESSRARAALELVAARSNWGTLPAGRFQGIAVCEAFNTVAAQVVEISVEGANIRVHKVTCAVECGRAVNPDIVAAQLESGVIFALSAALISEITISDGAVVQSGFHDFEPVRMQNAPAIDVHIVPSEAAPTGVGELGVPPLAAALGNAIFAATGQRLRELPFRLR